MAKLSEELLAAADDAEATAAEYLRDGNPEGYEVSRALAAHMRRIAAHHVAAGNDPEQFAGRSTAEVAAALGVTEGRVRQLARSLGVGTRVGRDWRFSGNDVAALRRRATKRGPKPRPDAT